MEDKSLLNRINEIRKTPIVFILGAPRSGTTLLQSSLNAHPNIIAPPESQFINLFYPRFGKIKHLNNKSIVDFAGVLFSEPLFKSLWSLNRDEFEKQFTLMAENADYPLLCKLVFFQYPNEKKEVSLISDKNPRYSLFAKRLLKIFPEARFIHIIRDPRDNVNSNLKRLNKKNPFFLARQWLEFNRCIENAKRKYPSKFFTIIYENMVSSPEETFGWLCDFLGLPFSELMLQHEFPERLKLYEGQRFYERAKKAHQNLLQPINTSNIGKWKTEISEYDKAVTEIITAKFAKQFYDYDIEVDKQSSARISSLKLFKSWLIYACWEIFTKLRFRNYAFNKWYYLTKKRF